VVMIPCTMVDVYKHLGKRRKHSVPPKSWSTSTWLHGVITTIWIFAAMETSNLTALQEVSCFYWTSDIIIMLANGRYWPIPWASRIQSTFSVSISSILILILPLSQAVFPLQVFYILPPLFSWFNFANRVKSSNMKLLTIKFHSLSYYLSFFSKSMQQVLEKLTVVKLLQKFTTSCRSWRFIAVFKKPATGPYNELDE
jgi:hypothetical protein